MRLESFRITNFRSISDSGQISVSQITALLGRNESGKSNLLRALYSLNPVDGFRSLNPVKDFPRHRRLDECTDDTEVVWSHWVLDESDRSALSALFPRAATATHVEIRRSYGVKSRTVEFVGLPVQGLDVADIKAKIRKIAAAVKAAGDEVEPHDKKERLERAADTFESALMVFDSEVEWAGRAATGLQALRKALAYADTDLSEKQEKWVADLEEISSLTLNDQQAGQTAKTWVEENLPHFVYLDEYPSLDGHQNIADYLDRKLHRSATVSDREFERLCKVAGLEPGRLQDLLGRNDQETRNQLVNRAGAVVTKEVRRLWRDRSLKIRFNLDAQHLDTLISDPNAMYDVEVNLNERSRGFQWFFSFYITFSADTNGGSAENAILLLDEPGLYLHAKSQADLLVHFEKDFRNQIVYTTHSPFMVPVHSLDSIRTVNISDDDGTTVTNDPTGDSRTLFPLQAALGYSISQSLFIGPNNLVVEGVTDFWILSSVSEYLKEMGAVALRADLTITPAGGAQKVSYMVALLSSEELGVLVLLDQERDSVLTKDDLVKSKLISDRGVIFVSEAFADVKPSEADIEDLLDPSVYLMLVEESYAKELKGKELALNPKVPRIARRVESALKDLGIEFHKTRPTRLFLKKMQADPGTVVTPEGAKRFEELFKIVNERFERQLTRGVGAFR